MIYLILIFVVLFFLLAWRRLDLAVIFLIAGLPAYLIRFNIFGLPATLLEAMIWAVFLVWAIKNFKQVKNNFLENFKKGTKIKVRYPFDWEIILLLLIVFTATVAAGFSSSSLGIFKAYFFEPIMLFIVILNVMKGDKGREKILWSLAISALAVSALAIYQKITGQLISNPLWAAVETRRVVSFFGYPNAVGLYLGPIVLIMIGWLASAVTYARNDKIKIIFINLTIILSSLSIYFAKSKGALLGVAAGLIVFGLMANKKIRWATIIALILISLGIAAYKPARDLAVSNITLTNLSGQIRKAGWNDSWKMLKDGRFLTGAGLANYQSAVEPYHTEGIFIKDFNDPDAQRKLVFNEAYRTAHWQPLEIYLYPHNIFLNFWSELGLAGMLLFIWVIGKFFVMGARNLRTQKNKYIVIGLIGAMVVVVVHGLVDVPYFKNDLAAMFWLFIAMVSLINLENQYGKNDI
ncbi:MAG: O-antigen ligase family protein [Patescibacteria group bacterium]